VQTDWETYTQLRAMAATNPQKFGSTDLRSYFTKLGNTQREQLLDLQTKLKDPASQPKIASLTEQLSVAHNQLKLKGEDRGKFDSAVLQAIASETAEKKRDLTFDERDKIVKRMMLPTETGRWFGTDKLYEVAGTSKEGKAVPKIDDDAKKLITQALKSEGIEPTDAAIRARFNLRYGIR